MIRPARIYLAVIGQRFSGLGISTEYQRARIYFAPLLRRFVLCFSQQIKTVIDRMEVHVGQCLPRSRFHEHGLTLDAVVTQHRVTRKLVNGFTVVINDHRVSEFLPGKSGIAKFDSVTGECHACRRINAFMGSTRGKQARDQNDYRMSCNHG